VSFNVRQTLVCRAAVGLAFLLALAACSHQPSAGPGRIAVLRFENLTSDVSLDWMGRAASEIIAREMSGGKDAVISASALHANPLAQQRALSAPGESAERDAGIAEGATRLVSGRISRVAGRLLLDVTQRDPATGTTVENFSLASPNAQDLYSLADAVARHLSPQVAPFETRNNEAIAAWARGLEATSYDQLTANYAHAVQADPQFATAWFDWASTVAGHGDRAEAARILKDAGQHADRFNSTDRARLKLATVELTGDRAATLAAMNELGKLTPNDPASVGALADRNFAARQYQAAVAGYRRLTQLAPGNGNAWNQLGYALMGSGDYEAAMTALRSYQHLLPNDANPLDSQGDVAFAFGRFSEAEKFYRQATAKDPQFANSGALYKAAAAHLMTGDIAGADRQFQDWAKARRAAKDESVDLRSAQWAFLSGKHDQAISALSNVASAASAPALKAAALTQVAIWELQLGLRDRALRDSDLALKTGAPPASALIARFASEDLRTAGDWSSRADRMFNTPQLAQLKPAALAYALYFSHQWDAAAPLWKQMLDRSTPDDSITPAIYGQILVELKRPRDAEPYVRLFPIPNTQALQEFYTLAVPKIFDTRAQVLASEASRKIFNTLWGGS
jgi:tetratricopeptide (TPR) repeat protein